MKSGTILVLAIPLFSLAAGEITAGELKRDYNKSFEVKRGDRLRLRHGDGDVTIKPWKENRLEVSVHYYANLTTIGVGGEQDFDVEFRQEGDVVYVTGEEHSKGAVGIHYFNRYEYTYTIFAPDYLGLDLDGEDGDVEIDGWTGEIECNAEDGDVQLYSVGAPKVMVRIEDGDLLVEDSKGDYTLTSEDGDVTINNCNGVTARVLMEDGEVRVRNCSGNFKIEGEDGGVRFDGVRVRELSIRMDDGDVRLDLLQEKNVDYDIKTSDGEVKMFLQPGISAAFSIDTEDGRITVDLPGASKIDKGHHWISGELLGGEGRIQIRTSDGNVMLRELH